MSLNVWSISQLVNYIKTSLDNDPNTKAILVKGEISNFVHHRSGHYYFTLKDAKARLSCVMFNGFASKCSLDIKDGMQVILHASVSMYEPQGSIQLYVNKVELDGVGDLFMSYMKLRKQLHEEGLFNKEYKKELPKYPMSIALLSAPTGAAIHDLQITISRRWPIANVVVYPCLVQGNDAPKDIINKLIKADQSEHDIIILARGGGSLEDLWAFNNEELVRTIFKLNTFTLCGVGHESDVTLVDYVCDLRGATPTAAAELATPDINEVNYNIQQTKNKLIQNIRHSIVMNKNLYQSLSTNKLLMNPLSIVANDTIKLNMLEKSLNSYAKDMSYQSDKLIKLKERMIQQISNLKMKQSLHISNDIQLLDAYSPLKILSRGYSIVYQNNNIIRTTKDINIEETLDIKMSDDTIKVKVIKEN
ncbi:MAG: exodeoxyribonuclease VII large subunit [Erysipelotrichaceae bacterium]